ncbi:hypothetical protein FRB94_006435 [Tulasnella sp. JGI-2019a]|nr:hypothetical protein FRB94_006435 [Tulasnella sp. JGI-2019a]
MTPNALPLPVELLLMIIRHLSHRDMLSTLQTCQSMRRIVETRLYMHLLTPFDDLRMVKLLRTLHTRPDLAHNIITFDGSLYPALQKPRFPRVVTPTSLVKNWYQRWSMIRRERTLSHMTVTSILHMVNVRSLTLRDFRWLKTTSAQTLISHAICSTVSLPSLTSLTIHGSDFRPETKPNYVIQLSLILRYQPFLERLELRSGEWDLERWIFPTDLPRLTHLMSGPEEAKVLVPGRPITSLALRKLSVVPRMDVWVALTTSTSPIHALKVDVLQHDVLLSILHFISSHLQDVEDLTLNGPTYETLPLLTQGFPSLPSLRILHVTLWVHLGCEMESVCTTLREGRRADLVTRLRSECPEFKSLDYRDRGCLDLDF